MADIAALVRLLGGMAQKQQLVRRGARDLDLTRAVRSGEVIRARQGWYTVRPASEAGVRAVRVGGRLTGISAIEAMGGWVEGPHPLHVSVNENASRLRTQQNRFRRLNVVVPAGVVLHWDSRDVGERGTATSVGLRDALHRVICDESLEVAIAALDWALHTGQVDEFDVHALMLGVPRSRRIPVDWLDVKCESLPESLARTRLRLEGFRVESQVLLQTGEPLDLVVEGVTGLEVDGREFHENRFLRDRRKDLHATIEGFHVLRPAAVSVFTEWPLVLAAVQSAVRARQPSPAFGNSGVRGRGEQKTPRTPRQDRQLLNFRRRNMGGAGMRRRRAALALG
jgi:very-short-patch-repair endonuclease